MKLILFLFLGYSIFKISQFVLPFFKLKSKINEQETKANFKRKVNKMDIQDAEYEDIWNLKNTYSFVQMTGAKIVQERVVELAVDWKLEKNLLKW